MIAEDAQLPAHGRGSRRLAGAAPDTFCAPSVESPAGPTGRLGAGQAAAGLEGGVERAAAALKASLVGAEVLAAWRPCGLDQRRSLRVFRCNSLPRIVVVRLDGMDMAIPAHGKRPPWTERPATI